MTWNHSRRILTKTVTKTVLLITLLFSLSCKDDGVEVTQPLGDYMFVERTIVTDATLLRGDPSWVLIQVIEPSMFYTFDSQARTLNYRGARLPINGDLKLIFAHEHYLLLPHQALDRPMIREHHSSYSTANVDTNLYITTGAQFWLTPVYFPPHYIDPSLAVQEIGDNGIVGITITGISPEIILSPDSMFVQVTTRIDSVLQFGGESGNWAVFEFKDSLTIKNHGFQPKQNVIWSPIGIGGVAQRAH